MLGLALLATSVPLVGATILRDPPGGAAIALAGLGTVSLVSAGFMIRSTWSEGDTAKAALLAVVGLAGITALWYPSIYGTFPQLGFAQLLATALAALAIRVPFGRSTVAREFAVAGLVLLLVGGIRLACGESVGIDVYELHEAAAAALSNGLNPYTSGNVAVLESHPFDGQELIAEYTYPPLTMVL